MHLDGWLCHLQRIVRGGRRLRLRLSGPALSRLCSGVGDPGVRWRQEMVKMRHVAEVPDIGFAPPVGLPPGLEVMTLADLRGRAADRMGAGFMRPLRPRFHHLVALQRGWLRQTVDFTGYDLEPGTWLWVRPGQVHQWGDLASADGTLIIFEQGFLDPATSVHLGDPHGAVVRVPAEPDQEALRAATSALEGEFRAPGRLPLETHLAILRHLLSVVVLNLAQLGSSPGDPAPQATQAFLR